MAENDRVRAVRKDKNLTLEKFGEAIGMGKSSVSDIENGRRLLTKQTRLSICREFDVSEKWLRTGEGDMYVGSMSSRALDDLAKKFKLRQRDYVLIERLIQMTPEQRDGILRFMEGVVDGIRSIDEDAEAETEVDAMAEEAARLTREQFLSEKKPGSSASSVSGSDVG